MGTASSASAINSPLIPAMELVHNGLLSRQRLIAAIERELAKVLDGISTFDRLHDRKKRGAYGLLDVPGRAHRRSGQGRGLPGSA
jgi:hypothetical protein